MLRHKILSAILIYTFLFSTVAFGQTTAVKTSAVYTAPKETIDKIREEGMGKNSQVMQTLSYMTDVIGGRLTNSPSMKRANEWTRDQMAKWGMQNARLESWGPFGRGWSLKSFNAQVVAPQSFPVIAYPKAWAPSTKGAVTSEVVYLDAKTDEDLIKFKGQLKGKIVLVSAMRKVDALEKSLMSRYSDEQLARLAGAPDPSTAKESGFTPEVIKNILTYFNFQARRMKFLMDEGAALMIDNSPGGSGGTIFVQGAALAIELSPNIKTIEDLFNDAGFQPHRKGAEASMMPQVTMATEDYNRLVRMIQLGVKPTMTVEVNAQYHDEDLMGYNTIAEIPGTDLKDEVVMLGGHLDSWHASTGATDNGAGCAVVMEAARIIQSLGLKPRRTIRVALWSGEEQGLYGSTEYVKKHFGEMKGGALVKGKDYEKLSAYYNLDNGTGKIRGVYMQGNSAVRPFFEAWLAPFGDLGAKTLTLANTGGTDHLPFDAVGLPGFQFIQDQVEYETRTHHSNQDNFDRIQAEDMRQAATIMAAFVYQTAMMDERLPRKALK